MSGFSLQSGIDDLINMENTMGILKLTTATLVAATLACLLYTSDAADE